MAVLVALDFADGRVGRVPVAANGTQVVSLTAPACTMRESGASSAAGDVAPQQSSTTWMS